MPSSKDYTKNEQGIPIIKIGDLQNGSVMIGSKTSRVPNSFIENPSIKKSLLHDGDILIAMTGATTGKIAKYSQKDSERAYLNQRVGRFIVDEDFLTREFVQFLTQTETFRQRVQGNILAAAQGNISPKKIEDIPVSLPPLPEQKKIAYVLSTVQRAIEQQERIIQTTTELKKALMQKLFTEGLHGEPQKMTEIGPVPESWEVVELDELLTATQYGLSLRGNSEGRYPILRMTNQVNGRIVPHDLQFVDIGEDDFKKFEMRRGDILFNRTNSFELVGRTAIFDLDGEYVFASYLIRLKTDLETLDPFYLNHYFNCDETQQRLKTIATRAVSQSNISATRLRGFEIPLPILDEQKQVVESLDFIDDKIANSTRRKTALEELFRTLLHLLMTAQIRVNNLQLGIEKLE